MRDETQSELTQLKSSIVTVAADILENVQNQILPLAEESQNEALNSFRFEFTNLLQTQNLKASETKLLDDSLKDVFARLDKLEWAQNKLHESQSQSQQIILEQTRFQDQVEDALLQAKEDNETKFTQMSD